MGFLLGSKKKIIKGLFFVGFYVVVLGWGIFIFLFVWVLFVCLVGYLCLFVLWVCRGEGTC